MAATAVAGAAAAVAAVAGRAGPLPGRRGTLAMAAPLSFRSSPPPRPLPCSGKLELLRERRAARCRAPPSAPSHVTEMALTWGKQAGDRRTT